MLIMSHFATSRPDRAFARFQLRLTDHLGKCSFLEAGGLSGRENHRGLTCTIKAISKSQAEAFIRKQRQSPDARETRAAESVHALDRHRRDLTIPVSQPIRFHLASLAKAMTATMVATLAEECRLAWQSSPLDVFPEWKNSIHPAFSNISPDELLRRG